MSHVPGTGGQKTEDKVLNEMCSFFEKEVNGTEFSCVPRRSGGKEKNNASPNQDWTIGDQPVGDGGLGGGHTKGSH